MIICESDGDLVLELLYNALTIAMDKFLKLMVPDLTPRRSSRTPPNEDKISSPTSYLLRSKSRRFYQRKSLQFDTIMEMSENPIDFDVSRIGSAQEENTSNSSFNKDLEEFKFYMTHQKTVQNSSPKLITSNFEDSGFLNCSIEMTSRLETISEMHSPQDDKFLGHEISFDSYFQEEADHLDSWLKVNENSSMNCDFNLKSGDQNFDEFSTKYFLDGSMLSNDKLIAGVMNDGDSGNGIESCPAHNESMTITDNLEGNDATARKFTDIASTN